MDKWSTSLRARTLDEILAMFPASAEVLRAHGFRECDRRATLQAAAARRGIEADQVIMALHGVADLVA